MSEAMKRAARQMTRDGISKLARWKSGKRHLGATIQTKLLPRPCGQPGCSKAAGYNTPAGPRCYGHALATQSTGETK